MLYTKTVSPETLDLIQQLIADPVLKDFYLVGGTALSLQIGHRLSIDIDLFTNAEFDSNTLSEHLTNTYGFEPQRNFKNTLRGTIQNIAIDLLRHDYKLLRPLKTESNIRLISLFDLSAMKINAIVGSGKRLKDFMDIYCLLEYIPLQKMMDAYLSKYPHANQIMAEKSLMFHDDIDFSLPLELIGKGVLNLEDLEKRFTRAFQFPDRRIRNSTLKKTPGKRKGRGI